MKIRPKKLILPAALLVAVVAIVLWSAARPTGVEAETVGRGTVRHVVEEEGRTRVRDRFVLSAPVAGRLLRVTHEEDRRVSAGEKVAEIDPLSLESRVARSEAQIAGLEARVAGVGRRRPKPEEIERSENAELAATEAAAVAASELASATAREAQARRDAGRAEDLAADGTITRAEKEEVDLAVKVAEESMNAAGLQHRVRELDLSAARLATKILRESAHDVDWEEALYAAQIREVREALRVLKDDLRRVSLTSPVDGRILRRFHESETVVAAGEPILEVGSLEALEVEADLLSEDAAHMKPGMRVEIHGRALGGDVVVGKLLRIYPAAFEKRSSLGVEQQRVTVLATFEREPESLGDRYRVELRVILDERENAVLVPEAALFRSEGEWRLFEVDGGRARLRTVKTGLRDGRVREVLSGLAEGAKVILHPDAALEDGSRVEILGE